MKKIILLFALISTSFLLEAQVQFEEILTFPEYVNDTGVYEGSVAFADIDGDNDKDVLVTGSFLSNLYSNDGSGNYTLVTGTPFPGVSLSSIAFADIDGDNDQDVLITGDTTSSVGDQISQLYKNDGLGHFTLVSGTPFSPVYGGDIAFADIDNDNDQDVLITGDSFSNNISELYINDGLGNFSLVSGTNFSTMYGESIAFADVDNDNDQDLLITGSVNSNLYINDGSGTYTLSTGTSLLGVSEDAIAFADIDNDNDQDLLITGKNSSNTPVYRLYKNDGSGNFAPVPGEPFPGVKFSAIAFADVDNDNDQDLLITGTINSNNRISNLYINNGTGTFTLLSSTPFPGVNFGSVAFTDIDNDNDQDLLITGLDNSSNPTSNLYRNVSTLGIKENTLSSSKLYPNPVSNELTIENQGNINQIEVYNITGQLLQTVNPQSSVVKINFSAYEQGIYLVKVHTQNGEISTARVVKE